MWQGFEHIGGTKNPFYINVQKGKKKKYEEKAVLTYKNAINTPTHLFVTSTTNHNTTNPHHHQATLDFYQEIPLPEQE